MIRALFLIATLLLSLNAQASLSASVDRIQLRLGESVELLLQAQHNGSFGRPDLEPLTRDFETLGSRQVNRLLAQDGQTQVVTQWHVTLKPRHSGNLEIPALALGEQRSEPIRLQVLEADSQTLENLAPVFIDASLDHETVYVQAQALLTLRIYHSVSLYDDSQLGPLEMSDARIEQLGSPKTYEKLIQGVRHGVIEIRYAVFPQKSGELLIPSQLFSATLATATGGTRQINVPSPEIPLQVKPRPAQYPAGAPWLPARALSLSESWSPEADRPLVGDALTRTVQIKADGLTASQLPDLPQVRRDGLKSYPDQPQLEDQASDLGITGSRKEQQALVPTRAGNLELPAIEVVWWNTLLDRLERSTLPARSLPVGHNPKLEASPMGLPASQDTSQLWLWQLACLLLAMTTAIGFGLWWHARRQPAVLRPVASGPDPRTLLDDLRRACNSHDAQATRQALDAWARQQPETLADMAARFEPLSLALDELNAALYSETLLNWQGEDLWQAIVTLPEQRPEQPPVSENLPPLYPK